MSRIHIAMTGYLGYRGREGQLAFMLHRVTGLGTVLFLVIHILDTAMVYFYPDLYLEAIKLYRTTLFGFGELGLVFCVFYHGLNGLRIAYLDLARPQAWHLSFARNSVKVTLAATLALWLPAAFFMLRSLLVHNFGLFGG